MGTSLTETFLATARTIGSIFIYILNSLIRNCSTESQHQNQIKIQKASDHGENFETSFTLVRCEIQFHAILEL